MLRQSSWGPFWPCLASCLFRSCTDAISSLHTLHLSMFRLINCDAYLIQTLPLLSQLLGSLVSSFPGQVFLTTVENVSINDLGFLFAFFARWGKRWGYCLLPNKKQLLHCFSLGLFKGDFMKLKKGANVVSIWRSVPIDFKICNKLILILPLKNIFLGLTSTGGSNSWGGNNTSDCD